MKQATVRWHNTLYELELDKPVDIAIGLRRTQNVNAFYLPDPIFETVKAGSFVGDVNQGGSCNVENITISPHGNGTHTECIGHISKEHHALLSCLRASHLFASLLTIPITGEQGNQVVDERELSVRLTELPANTEALLLRTQPNNPGKQQHIHSGSQPPYLTQKAIKLINEQGIEHLLVDLPSLDHEEAPDLPAHHAFFGYPDKPQYHKTVTELTYIPDQVPDGLYLLNLQVISIESDASPSRPLLYALNNPRQEK